MRRSMMAVLMTIFIAVSAHGQDLKKVVEIVKQMESELKAMIQNEEKARSVQYAELAAQLAVLQGKKAEAAPAVVAKLKEEEKKVDVRELVARLQVGNVRFVSGKISGKDYPRQRPELAKGQHPYVIVLSCSDSRVPPELVFDESLGQLFIIRVAGNVVDSVALGSIEYAAEHLHTSLLLVLGHESCGAVKATLAGGEVPPNIGSLARRIQPAAERIKAKHLDEKQTVAASVEENVREQMTQAVLQSTVLNELVEKGELSIAGAVYSLETGKVRFLGAQDESKVERVASATPKAPVKEKAKEGNHGH